MIQKRPQTLEKAGRNLSLGALVVLLAVLPFEEGVDATYRAAEIAVLLGFILRLAAQMNWKFWATAAGIWAISFGAFAGAAAMSAASEDILFTFGQIMGAALKEVSILYFCMLLIFLSQFVWRPDIWTAHDRWTRVTLAFGWGMAVVVIFSAIMSLDPAESLAHARKYFIPYTLLYMVVVETLYSWRHFKIVITTIFLVGVIVSTVTISIRYFYENFPEVQQSFVEKDWVLPQVVGGQDELRNQWPFEHHNRLSSFALIVSLFVWLQFFVTRNWELRTLVGVSILLPFWTMILTLTRGSWVGLAFGVVALVLMVNWRSIGLLAVIGVAIYVVAPPEVEQRIDTMINPKTYFGQGAGTIGLRKQIWTYSFDVIGKYPFLGVGYGWDVFEDYVNANYEPLVTGETISHAHNNYLEVAAETGMLGFLVFLGFNGLLFVQIIRAWRMTERQTKPRFVVAGFFGLLVAINMYGMSNYSLRYTIGMLIWICFALMTLLPSIVRFIPVHEENGNGAPRPAEPSEPAAIPSKPPEEVREEIAAEPEKTDDEKRSTTSDNGQ